MVGAAYQQKSCQTADGTGQEHGADDDLLHLDANVAGGTLTLAHNGDLIAVLGVVQVDIHGDGEQCHHKNIQQVLVATDLGQPAGHGALVNHADLAGALGHLPHDDEEGDQLSGHIVHHQGEQGLVGIPLCLEEGGNGSPDGACQNAGDDHNEDQQPVGDLITQQDHAGRGGKTAHQHLTFTADVPEAHLEGGGDGQRNAQQNGDVLEEDPDLPAGAEGALKDGLIDSNGVLAGEGGGDQRVDDQRQHDGCGPDAPCAVPGKGFALGDMNKGNLIVLMHC